MASTQTSTLGNRQIQQALRRGAKAVLVAGGIQPSTRRGNKELTLAVQRLAQQPYSTLEEATQAGEALGQKIVEISQAKGISDLDGGIVRQLMLTGNIPTVTKVTTKPAKTTPVVVAAPQTPAPTPAPVVEEAAEAAEPIEAEIEADADAIAAAEPTPEPAAADTEPEAVELAEEVAAEIETTEPIEAEIEADVDAIAETSEDAEVEPKAVAAAQ